MNKKIFLLNIRLQMEGLITRREAMVSCNEVRKRQDLSLAYGEGDFTALANEFFHLVDVLQKKNG